MRSEVDVLVYKVLHGCAPSFTYVADLQRYAEDLALPAANASFSFIFTAPLFAAEHFWLLNLRYGTRLPATGVHVGTVSGDLPHSTQDGRVY